MLFPLPLRGEAVLLRNEDEELKEESLLLFPELLELLPDLEEKGLILALPPPLLLLSLKANGSELFLLSDEAETPFPGRCPEVDEDEEEKLIGFLMFPAIPALPPPPPPEPELELGPLPLSIFFPFLLL